MLEATSGPHCLYGPTQGSFQLYVRSFGDGHEGEVRLCPELRTHRELRPVFAASTQRHKPGRLGGELRAELLEEELLEQLDGSVLASKVHDAHSPAWKQDQGIDSPSRPRPLFHPVLGQGALEHFTGGAKRVPSCHSHAFLVYGPMRSVSKGIGAPIRSVEPGLAGKGTDRRMSSQWCVFVFQTHALCCVRARSTF